MGHSGKLPVHPLVLLITTEMTTELHQAALSDGRCPDSGLQKEHT